MASIEKSLIDCHVHLVKVLPNAQQFNPVDSKYRPFYRALVERKLPLLSHVGFELSLIGKDQSVGEPDRLRRALDEGVMVIAAHVCSYGLMLQQDAVKVRQRRSRIAQRLNVRQRVRFASSLAAALLDGLFAHPAGF
jgi:predicted TIM-barrel fold metal-dependent hydrolase